MTPAPTEEAAARAAAPAILARLVHRRVVADTLTAVAAAQRLFEPGRGDWLLESVEGGAIRGRYSLLGIEPDLVLRGTGVQAQVNRQWREDRAAFEPVTGDPLQALRALAAECRIDPLPEGLPNALAFLVGYFSYESFALVEPVGRAAPSDLTVPDLVFVRPTLLLVFDRLADTLDLIAPVWAGGDEAAARSRIDEALTRLSAPAPASAPQPPPAASERAAITHAIAPQRYAEMVRQAQAHIAAGDIFQVVLAQRFTQHFALPPLALYRALRRINPSPFLYFLDLPNFAIVGSSPEILVRVRDRRITVRPIAGTRPRGRDEAEDVALRGELLADPKERAEHLMLLDLGRNDVGRAAAPGSVTVTESFTVEHYSHVMHIVSNVTGDLRDGSDALDALFAGFPAGTVSGAPKVRAAQIIAALEPETRGAYAGGIAYFAADGSMDSCIVLRTGVIKDGVLHVTAGAGIVADSDPASEQCECEAKARALFRAADEARRLAREGSPL